MFSEVMGIGVYQGWEKERFYEPLLLHLCDPILADGLRGGTNCGSGQPTAAGRTAGQYHLGGRGW
jgi:hypothetical protein